MCHSLNNYIFINWNIDNEYKLNLNEQQESKDEKQKAKRTGNDVAIAPMSFLHLNNSIVIHEQTNQVSFFSSSN